MRFRDYIPYYKRNLKVAGPIVLSQVGVALTQLVDTFMVGKLGTTELAAVSLASSIALMGFLFVNGLLDRFLIDLRAAGKIRKLENEEKEE